MDSSSEHLGAVMQLIAAPFRRKPIPAFLSPSNPGSLESLAYDQLPSSSLPTSRFDIYTPPPNSGKWKRRKRRFEAQVERLFRTAVFANKSTRRRSRSRAEYTRSQRARRAYEHHPYKTTNQKKYGYESTTAYTTLWNSYDRQRETPTIFITKDRRKARKRKSCLRSIKSHWTRMKLDWRLFVIETGKNISFWTIEVGSYILLAPVLIPWEILTLLGLLLLRIWTRCQEFHLDTFLIKVRDRSGWIGEGGWVGMVIGLLLATGGRFLNKVHH